MRHLTTLVLSGILGSIVLSGDAEACHKKRCACATPVACVAPRRWSTSSQWSAFRKCCARPAPCVGAPRVCARPAVARTPTQHCGGGLRCQALPQENRDHRGLCVTHSLRHAGSRRPVRPTSSLVAESS
jgi:hypothetical protein